MSAHRVTVSVAVAAVLSGAVAVAIAASPSETIAGAPTYTYRGPVATASGGGSPVLIYPTLVAVHLDRGEAALARAETTVDGGKAAGAVPQISAATAQMTAAWAAAKYVIKTTPPPPPIGDRAGTSGGAPAGPTYAAPPDTSLAVLTLQHDVVGHSAGLLGSNAALNTALVQTMKTTADSRDAAIAYIHRVAPPPPPPSGRAGASGGAVTSGFDTTMPSVLPLLDDEIQALKGTLALNQGLPATVTAAVKALVQQDRKTEATINKFWPPIPVGD